MTNTFDYTSAILNAWKTSNRTTVFLIEHLPKDLWDKKNPGQSHRTIGMIARHIHNTRCMWIKMIGRDKIIKVPSRVDPHHADHKEVIAALKQSHKEMLNLLQACINNGGKLPSIPPWLNFPNDVVHLLSYFIAHEAHHRGQIILMARQLNHRLPLEVSAGVWQWKQRLKEAK